MSDRDFGFPYKPYTIQNDFMNALYNVLTESKIGIFESPTGTGKSLSLICGSLSWLKDQNENENNTAGTDEASTENDEPDWVRAFTTNKFEKKAKQEKERRKNELRKRIQRARQQEKENAAFLLTDNTHTKARKQRKNAVTGSQDELDEFLVDEYHSDDEQQERAVNTKDPDSNLSDEVRALLAKLESEEKSNLSDDNQDDNEEEEDIEEMKIYYTSRTHSQLSQFIHEVQKTRYAEDIWAISMGSRKNLCINKNVQKLQSLERINEVCLDLQKKDKTHCPYLPSSTEKSMWNTFRDHALAGVRDIEDLVKVGETLSVCPYYGSRHTLKPAQLVVLPYQHLLHANTRETLGISLKNSVVIVDEAHNLIETINSIHTVTLSLYQIRMALNQLTMYLQRYKSRLLGKNVVYIKQIMMMVKALMRCLESNGTTEKEQVMNVNTFVHVAKVDHLNMFKIEKYLKESKLARKLNGFAEKAKELEEMEKQKQRLQHAAPPTSTAKAAVSAPPNPPLTLVETFLMALTNPDANGRIVINRSQTETEQPHIKYMLLNPADVFEPIINESRSVILAGGTMEPVSDFKQFLFSNVPDERIVRFSCGHIIPEHHLSVMSVEEGPTGRQLIFTFESRQDVKLMDEVGLSIINLCNTIPDGVVCFFPSFTLLELMYKRWTTPESGNILERLSKRKKIFKEPRESTMVDDVLREYAMHIDSQEPGTTQHGAVLLSVVNGKMSEGINFSDRLGRGIIMIGLPFANSGSIELQEKMKFVSQNGGGNQAGREYYENLCMRGVNQSIGRAIRHKDDYATIVLLDKRYATDRIRKKLPGWIGAHIDYCNKFGKAMGNTARFFRQWRAQH